MEILRRLRTERGLSQARLAARAELDPSTVNQIERGARDASPATLHKLADALDVGLYELLEGEPSPKAPPELDADDLEDWASGVDSIPELKRAAKSLWPLYGQLAGTAGRSVPAEDAGQLAEVGRKLDIINERMVDLAPEPLATIVMHLGEPTQIFYHRDPTDEERTRLRAEYPDAVEVEAKQVAFAY